MCVHVCLHCKESEHKIWKTVYLYLYSVNSINHLYKLDMWYKNISTDMLNKVYKSNIKAVRENLMNSVTRNELVFISNGVET